MTNHVITANRLLDGLVVYQTATGEWSELAVAAVVGTDDLAAAMELGRAAEDRQEVTGVYEVEVDIAAGSPVPMRLRERIRAYGPTTHPDFGRAGDPAHFQHPDGVNAVRFGR